MVSWRLSIAKTTALTYNMTVATLPAGFYYSGNTTSLPGDLFGTGLSADDFAPTHISSARALSYCGPGLTTTATGYWLGQGIFSNST